ncbi:MAG: type II secretion system F family protein [Pikeienuella sp.]|uniref:type II secretion system F family protein n=1 Tax=Pikeienuella sp. TaxID=2831957 RepID=UPI0039197DCD
MTTLYRYAAAEPSGARRRGVLSAASEAEAASMLERAGLTPLSLGPGRRPTRPRAKLADRAAALRRLASLTAARAPLDRALTLAGGSESAGPLFADLALAVASGRPLSAAMADWPGDFTEAESALLAAGEAAGDIARAAAAAAALAERRAAGRRALAGALAYPAFVLVAALMALAVFIGFAQPRFAEVLRATGAELSPATAAFFAISDVLRAIGGPLLLLLGAALLAAIVAGGTEGGRRALSGLALRLPLVGPLARDRAAESYAGALGAMLAGGAPLPEAARLAARTLSAPRLRKAAEAAARAVEEGRDFSAALSGAGFPPALPAFAGIGEETGELAPLMESASRHFADEAEARGRRLAAVAAPLATLILGLLIGAGAWLMMTAVLDVYDAAL